MHPKPKGETFDVMPVAEVRRLADLAIAHLREVCRGLAVEGAMRLEGAPGPLPHVDPRESGATLDRLMRALPPLGELEMAVGQTLPRLGEAEKQQLERALDEVCADKATFERDFGSAPGQYEALVHARESAQRGRIYAELGRELRAYSDAIRAFCEGQAGRLEEASTQRKAKVPGSS